MFAALAIRSVALSALALLVAWYALFGGRAALEVALPEASAFAPPAIATGPLHLPADALGLFIAAGTIFAVIAIRAAVQQSRRAGRMLFVRSHALSEDQLWAEHLVWLQVARERRRERSPFPRRRFAGMLNIYPGAKIPS